MILKKKTVKTQRSRKSIKKISNIENDLIKEKKKKEKKQYFGKNAHNAIVEYQSAETTNEKNIVYVDKIKPSFDKLAENLIFIHGFASDRESFEILKEDCVTFLFETLKKFDPERGSKAFSYFNVCAKNFLIIQSKKKMKNNIRHVSIDDFKNLNATEKNEIENHMVIPSQDDIMIRKEDKLILLELLDEIRNKITNNNEIQCLKAIKILFQNIDDLDFLNKRAVFVYLREISGLNPKQLSVAMSNIRKHYRSLVKNNTQYFLFG